MSDEWTRNNDRLPCASVEQELGAPVEDENSLIPAMIAVFLGLGGALAAVAVVIVTTLVLI